MATPRFAWGIDIGNRALKAVKLVPSSEGLRVDDFEVIEHEMSVLSAAGDNRESLIQSALANFVQRHPGVEKGQVGIGVSGQQSFARFIKLPPVEPNKIPEIVRFEAIQQIPFPLDDVDWSYQLFQDPESPEVEVGIFAMRKELTNAHIKNFTDIDLNVQVVQMNPLAVYNAMYYDNRIKGTTMVVDLGAETTDLIIAEGETIWLRSIPIGGNNFTEALTKAFKVNFTKAEDLKRNASTSKYGRQIMQAMRPIFADLVAEIQRSIGFYASVHKDSRIAKVIALGSTFRLPGLQKYLQQNLQLEVEKIDGLGAGVPSDPKLAATFSENLLSTVGAYGLALQVMGQGKISSSLLPEHIRREKMWREKVKWFAAAAALFVAAAAVPYGSYYFYNWQLAQQADTQQRIQTIETRAQDLDNQWSQIEQKGGPDRQRISNMDSIVAYRSLCTNLLLDIYNQLPQNDPSAPAALKGSDLAALKAIPRTERKQIFIQKIGVRYAPDVSSILANPDSLKSYADQNMAIQVDTSNAAMGGGMGGMGGGMGGMPGAMGGMPDQGGMGGQPGAIPPPSGAANGQRGFLVTIKCTTPNGTGTLLFDQDFRQKLTALKLPAMDKPYVFKLGTIANRDQLMNDAPLMQQMVASYQAKQQAITAAAAAAGAASPTNPMGAGMMGGAAAAGPMGGMAGAGVAGMIAQNPEEAFLDPATKEDVRNDWECTMVFLVLLDPPPVTAAAPGAPKPAGS